MFIEIVGECRDRPPLCRGECVAWILRLVKIGAEAEGQALDVMEINRPAGLRDIADLGLTLSKTKGLLARHVNATPKCPLVPHRQDVLFRM